MYQKESNLLYLLSVKIVIGVLIGVYCLFIKIYYTAVINKKKEKKRLCQKICRFYTHNLLYQKFLSMYFLSRKITYDVFQGGGGNIKNVIWRFLWHWKHPLRAYFLSKASFFVKSCIFCKNYIIRKKYTFGENCIFWKTVFYWKKNVLWKLPKEQLTPECSS